MTSIWPWLAVAGVGALHGLNPATGWLLAVGQGGRSGDRGRALRALVPIAVGHVASVAIVAGAVALGLAMDRGLLQATAAGSIVAVVIARLSGRLSGSTGAPAGHAGLALWSFAMSTAHGAGMMLVPALVPLCVADSPAREITASGSLALALAAVGVHAVAMLGVTGAVAVAACRGVEIGGRWACRRFASTWLFERRRRRQGGQGPGSPARRPSGSDLDGRIPRAGLRCVDSACHRAALRHRN